MVPLAASELWTEPTHLPGNQVGWVGKRVSWPLWPASRRQACCRAPQPCACTLTWCPWHASPLGSMLQGLQPRRDPVLVAWGHVAGGAGLQPAAQGAARLLVPHACATGRDWVSWAANGSPAVLVPVAVIRQLAHSLCTRPFPALDARQVPEYMPKYNMTLFIRAMWGLIRFFHTAGALRASVSAHRTPVGVLTPASQASCCICIPSDSAAPQPLRSAPNARHLERHGRAAGR